MIGSVEFFRKMIKGIVFFLFPLTLITLIVITTLFFNQMNTFESRIIELSEKIEVLESSASDAASSVAASSSSVSVAPSGSTAVNSAATDSVAENSVAANSAINSDAIYSAASAESVEEVKVMNAYLTFDDGPSENTEAILDILDEYEIKATFFVCNKYLSGYEKILQRIVNEGHSIGLHTASHDYRKIYKTADAFIEDMEENLAYVYKATGVSPRIIRFAGGSANDYNKAVREAIFYKLAERGIKWYDWNISTGDSEQPQPDSEKIVRNVLDSIRSKDRLIILAHDTASKDETVKALPQIIEGVTTRGFTFGIITEETEGMSLPGG